MRNWILYACGLSGGYCLMQPNSNANATVAAVTTNSTQIMENLKNSSLFEQGSVKNLQNVGEQPKDIHSNVANVDAMQNYSREIIEGRGKYKRRKMLKYLQPLLIGILVVKFILLPLTLKALTALSTSSFVMSKIALATAGLFVLKWLLTSSGGEGGGGGGYDGGAKERLEIVHLPLPLMKPYYHNRVHNSGWNDLSLSGSNNIFEIKPTYKRKHKYIPVNGIKDMAQVLAVAAVDSDGSDGSDGGGGGGGFGYRNTRPNAQHYDGGIIDGKPFL